MRDILRTPTFASVHAIAFCGLRIHAAWYARRSAASAAVC